MGYGAYFGKIRPGKQREYVEAHKAVWPELLEVMRQAGVSRESCFVLEDYVVVYVEADNIKATMDKLGRKSHQSALGLTHGRNPGTANQ